MALCKVGSRRGHPILAPRSWVLQWLGGQGGWGKPPCLGPVWEPGPPHLSYSPCLMFSRVPGQCRALAGPGVPVMLPTPAGTCCSLTREI